MADRFGTRRIFASAVALFLFGSLACGLSVNVPMLVASRVVQGMGGAMMTPVGRLVLVRTFPREEFIRAMNYVVIPSLIGPLVGPLVGGVIVHWFHWRAIFFLNLPLGAAGLWLIRRHMPDYRSTGVAPLDWLGFVLFGAGIAILSHVLEVFSEHAWRVGPLVAMTAAAAALLLLYGRHARRVPHPVLQLSIFKTPTFRLSVVGGFVTRIGIGGMPFLLPLLYQLGLGFHRRSDAMMPSALHASRMARSASRVSSVIVTVSTSAWAARRASMLMEVGGVGSGAVSTARRFDGRRR
jgi:MFS family permease